MHRPTVAASLRHGIRIVSSVIGAPQRLNDYLKKKGTPKGTFSAAKLRYPRQEPGRYFNGTVVPVPPQVQP
jgi:hypothetical protein